MASSDKSSILVATGAVVANRALPGRHYLLSVESPEMAPALRPGQFLELDCMSPAAHERFSAWKRGLTSWEEIRAFHPTKLDWNPPLIRRPMGYYRCYARSKGDENSPDTIDILFKVVGIGTELLASKRPGDPIDLLGPLGNSFTIEAKTEMALLVTGGTGLGPLVAWAEELARMGRKALLFFGAMNEASIPLTLSGEGQNLKVKEMAALGIEIHVATIDQSRPGIFRGLVTELFEQYAEMLLKEPKPVQVYACGPMGMMAAVARITGRMGLPCQVLLEERMACGFGGCKGCVCKFLHHDPAHRKYADPQAIEYRRVCVDGPIFDARDIVWE